MLENKVGMIFGVANKRSIAWACAQSCRESGAKLAFTYQGERLQRQYRKIDRRCRRCARRAVRCDESDRS